MGISVLIVIVVMFLIFMFSAKGVEDSAKNVSLVIGIVLIIFILFKVIRG